jgi:hypothetical protein
VSSESRHALFSVHHEDVSFAIIATRTDVLSKNEELSWEYWLVRQGSTQPTGVRDSSPNMSYTKGVSCTHQLFFVSKN